MKVKRWCCAKCGSTRVFSDAWVALNGEDEDLTFDAKHCEACEGECDVILQSVEATEEEDLGEAHYLNAQELATVLCALRLLQQVHSECGGDLPGDLQDIRDNAGTLEALELDEIDELCDRLNS